MPYISHNPVVLQIFDEFSADAQAWSKMNLIPSALEFLVQGKADILLKMHPELKEEEKTYLRDCFNAVPRPVQRPVQRPVEAKVVKSIRDHSTQTDS